ncbi:MAG: prepilin-type N-terminal cleavage/methylation domain-containing protein [Polyangiales bacterium]
MIGSTEHSEQSERESRGDRVLRGARGARAGFTLIELMVVLAIISIAMAAALPAMRQAMRDRRTQQAAIALLNDFREARSRATMRGRAHMVRVNISGSFTRVDIVEGDTNSCRLSNWSVPPSRLIFVEREWGDPALMVSDIAFNATGAALPYMEYCFTPMGRMFFRSTVGGVFSGDGTGTLAANGGFLYTVRNTEVAETVQRRVFIPLTGIARLAP